MGRNAWEKESTPASPANDEVRWRALPSLVAGSLRFIPNSEPHNEGHNPNYYEESVGKYVWTNLLSTKEWKGTIRDQNASSQVTATFKVSNDDKLEGQFTYIQKIGGRTTGKLINGKIKHLRNLDKAIRGVRIDVEWQLNQPAGSKGTSTGRGYWESAGETRLIGKWGWGKKNDNRGDWPLTK